jgi:hypothetical protein
MARRWLGVLALLPALVSCEARVKPGAPAAAAAASMSVTAPSASAALPTASASASGPVSSAAPPPLPPPAPAGDACRLTRGPIQLSCTGPVTLVADVAGGDPRVVFNFDGVPRAVPLPLTKLADGGKPERLTLGDPAERAGWPACATAGGALFCVDRAGALHRSALEGGGSTVLAQARPGAPVAAATVAGAHVVYAFLADRRTTEGATTLAYAALDDAPPVVLSEDGSGATFVTLASRGDEALAMYIDARRVLTPVHARVLRAAGTLGLGPDAVVFVGSGTDGRTPGALAQGASGHALALLPLDKDDHAFGMVSIHVEEQPRDDATTTWSLYPTALERPAVVATQGQSPIRVLRTLPAAAEPRGKQVLELGELDAAGAWKALCPVAEGAAFGDLAILADRAGALWIAYTDAEGTWIEKRGRQ